MLFQTLLPFNTEPTGDFQIQSINVDNVFRLTKDYGPL
jgi:hypothetical protein